MFQFFYTQAFPPACENYLPVVAVDAGDGAFELCEFLGLRVALVVLAFPPEKHCKHSRQ